MTDDLDFEDEKELQSWLKEEFLSYGWEAYREVSPKGTDYRADLIVYHENWGYIGIECKYMSSPRNGKKVGEAIEQIVAKYRSERYLYGDQVDLWAFCPYIENVPVTGINQTIREILCHFGIAILWPGDRMKIDFAYSSSDTKILLGDEDGEHYGDRERIRSMVQKKMGLLDRPTPDSCQYDAGSHGCDSEAAGTVVHNSYEIKLCQHHLERYEKEMAEDEKTAFNSSGDPSSRSQKRTKTRFVR